MDIIFSVIREDTFWKILLFFHFLMAVSLLAAVNASGGGRFDVDATGGRQFH